MQGARGIAMAFRQKNVTSQQPVPHSGPTPSSHTLHPRTAACGPKLSQAMRLSVEAGVLAGLNSAPCDFVNVFVSHWASTVSHCESQA